MRVQLSEARRAGTVVDGGVISARSLWGVYPFFRAGSRRSGVLAAWTSAACSETTRSCHGWRRHRRVVRPQLLTFRRQPPVARTALRATVGRDPQVITAGETQAMRNPVASNRRATEPNCGRNCKDQREGPYRDNQFDEWDQSSIHASEPKLDVGTGVVSEAEPAPLALAGVGPVRTGCLSHGNVNNLETIRNILGAHQIERTPIRRDEYRGVSVRPPQQAIRNPPASPPQQQRRDAQRRRRPDHHSVKAMPHPRDDSEPSREHPSRRATIPRVKQCRGRVGVRFHVPQ